MNGERERYRDYKGYKDATHVTGLQSPPPMNISLRFWQIGCWPIQTGSMAAKRVYKPCGCGTHPKNLSINAPHLICTKPPEVPSPGVALGCGASLGFSSATQCDKPSTTYGTITHYGAGAPGKVPLASCSANAASCVTPIDRGAHIDYRISIRANNQPPCRNTGCRSTQRCTHQLAPSRIGLSQPGTKSENHRLSY